MIHDVCRWTANEEGVMARYHSQYGDEMSDGWITCEPRCREDQEGLLMRQAAGVMIVYINLLRAERRLDDCKVMLFM